MCDILKAITGLLKKIFTKKKRISQNGKSTPKNLLITKDGIIQTPEP